MDLLLCRPRPVLLAQNYIDTVERDVNEISRTFITEYWFDDDEEKDATDFLNSGEWEAIADGNGDGIHIVQPSFSLSVLCVHR